MAEQRIKIIPIIEIILKGLKLLEIKFPVTFPVKGFIAPKFKKKNPPKRAIIPNVPTTLLFSKKFCFLAMLFICLSTLKMFFLSSPL